MPKEVGIQQADCEIDPTSDFLMASLESALVLGMLPSCGVRDSHTSKVLAGDENWVVTAPAKKQPWTGKLKMKQGLWDKGARMSGGDGIVLIQFVPWLNTSASLFRIRISSHNQWNCMISWLRNAQDPILAKTM